MADLDPVPECSELLDVVKAARARFEETRREYDDLAEPFQGKTIVVLADETATIEAVESAAERTTAAHNEWFEALKPWLACMKIHTPRR